MQLRNLLRVAVFGLVVGVSYANGAGGAELNHYGDYGLLEQTENVPQSNSSLSITEDPFGYSDAYTDSESGLQNLNVRYYNPLIMRFTSMDTAPLLNRYAYANENPIMNDDPSGHSAVGASNSSTLSFGKDMEGNFAGAMVFYGVMEVTETILSAGFPGLDAISLFLTQIPLTSGASLLSSMSDSLVMKQNLTAKGIGDAAVSGALGGVFSGAMSMVETPLLNSQDGFGFNHFNTTVITDMSSQVGLNAASMLTNSMFHIQNNFQQKGAYFGTMLLSLGLANLGFSSDDDFVDAYESQASADDGQTKTDSSFAEQNKDTTQPALSASLTAGGDDQDQDQDQGQGQGQVSVQSAESEENKLSSTPGGNYLTESPVTSYRRMMMVFKIGIKTVATTVITTYIH